MSDGTGNGTGERLLLVAARQFRLKGYAASTTRELAEELGIQRASLYHHIRAKEDLLFEICVAALRDITAAVERAALTKGPPRMQAVIEAHLASAVRHRDMHATMLVELSALSPARRAEIIEARASYEALLRGVIADEQAAGHLRDDLDARHLTLALLNVLNWTIFWFDPSGSLGADMLGRTLASIFLEGAGRP